MKKKTSTRSTRSDRGRGRDRCRIALTLLLAFGALAAAGPVPALAEESPSEVIDKTANSVIAVLRDSVLSSAQKRERIELIVYERVDFATLSRLVLARNWQRLSAEQREEFQREFKRHLSVTYGDNVDRYRNETVQIIGEREEARGDRTVLTQVSNSAETYSLNYRLRRRDGSWRIIDIIIEGVSMVSNFRSQFQEIIANGGPEKLLRVLREKNAAGVPLKS
jgi:phospholipid transport system substrate-binding protein